jgi:chromosome segregation ATPase
MTMMVTVLFALVFTSCSQGDSLPGETPQQGNNAAVSQGTTTGGTDSTEQKPTVVDSPELVQEVQVLLDQAQSGIASQEQGQTLLEKLNEIRQQVQSPELIEKIDAAIAEVKVDLISLASETELQGTITTVQAQYDTLIGQINQFQPSYQDAQAIESTIEAVNSYLAQTDTLISTLEDLKKALEGKEGFAEQLAQLEKQIAELKAKKEALHQILTEALAKKQQIVGKAEAEAQIQAKLKQLETKIGTLLAEVSVQYNQEKIELINSLINGISSVNDENQLNDIRAKLEELEKYVRTLLTYLKQQKGTLQSLKSQLQNLYQEAMALNSDKADMIKNYMDSLNDVELSDDIAVLEATLAKIQEAYKAIANKEASIKEAALKQALQQEYSQLSANYQQEAQDVQSALNQFNELIAQKQALEAKVEAGNATQAELEKLEQIKSQLNQINADALAAKLRELQQKAESLQQRSGNYLPQIGGLVNQIEVLKAQAESLKTRKEQATAELNGLKTQIEQIIEQKEKAAEEAMKEEQAAEKAREELQKEWNRERQSIQRIIIDTRKAVHDFENIEKQVNKGHFRAKDPERLAEIKGYLAKEDIDRAIARVKAYRERAKTAYANNRVYQILGKAFGKILDGFEGKLKELDEGADRALAAIPGLQQKLETLKDADKDKGKDEDKGKDDDDKGNGKGKGKK